MLPRVNPSNCHFLSTFKVSAVELQRCREPIRSGICSESIPVRRDPGAWEIPPWPHSFGSCLTALWFLSSLPALRISNPASFQYSIAFEGFCPFCAS